MLLTGLCYGETTFFSEDEFQKARPRSAAPLVRPNRLVPCGQL